MAVSLDGFIARNDGRVDWLETSDEFAAGDTMDPGFVEAFLQERSQRLGGGCPLAPGKHPR
jgi:dihydrofolate reductase